MNADQAKIKSVLWNALAIIGVGAAAFYFNQLTIPKNDNNLPTTTSAYVSCQINSKCGGGTKMLTPAACSSLSCCQIGNEWHLLDNSNECSKWQQAYTNYLIQNNANSVQTRDNSTQYCCKYCTKGQPCGDACISRDKVCRTGPGCACWGN